MQMGRGVELGIARLVSPETGPDPNLCVNARADAGCIHIAMEQSLISALSNAFGAKDGVYQRVWGACKLSRLRPQVICLRCVWLGLD